MCPNVKKKKDPTNENVSVPLNSRIIVKGKFVYYCEVRLVAFGGVGYEFFHKIFTLHARQMTNT